MLPIFIKGKYLILILFMLPLNIQYVTMPRTNTKKERISATLDTDIVQKIKALAKKERRSFSSMLEIMLLDWLNE